MSLPIFPLPLFIASSFHLRFPHHPSDDTLTLLVNTAGTAEKQAVCGPCPSSSQQSSCMCRAKEARKEWGSRGFIQSYQKDEVSTCPYNLTVRKGIHSGQMPKPSAMKLEGKGLKGKVGEIGRFPSPPHSPPNLHRLASSKGLIMHHVLSHLVEGKMEVTAIENPQ